MREPFEGQPEPARISLPVAAVVLIAAVAVLWLGVYPSQIINLAGHSIHRPSVDCWYEIPGAAPSEQPDD